MDDLDGLEIRHLRYFLTVAQAGSISAAAEELRIAQPSLSQQIQRLERRVGLRLFQRTPQGVQLTPAGEVFRRGAAQTLDRLRGVIASAGSVTSPLRVGVCAGVPLEVLTDVEQAVTGTPPDSARAPAGVTFRAEHSSRQLDLLRRGELDFGLVRLPLAESGSAVALAVVADEPLGVVLSDRHPLAARDTLGWADLAGQALLWFDERRAPEYASALLDQLAAGGWTPELRLTDNDRTALFRHALRNRADLVALRPAGVAPPGSGLVWRALDVPNPPRERLALLALRGTPHASTVRAAARRRNWPQHA